MFTELIKYTILRGMFLGNGVNPYLSLCSYTVKSLWGHYSNSLRKDTYKWVQRKFNLILLYFDASQT